MKKFQLTPDETKNIKGREMAVEYLLDLIKRDINMYLYADICPRLGLKDEVIELSPERDWLHVVEPKSTIIDPRNVKV